MPRLRMIDVGLPYKKIMQGSKWIGRVYKNAQGTYTGQIGKDASRHEATGATELEAFNEVGARFFGQPSAAALRAHNADVRHVYRVRRGQRQAFLDEMLRQIGRTTGLPNPVAERVRGPAGEDAVRIRNRSAEEEVNRLEQEGFGEDDFVPPRGRRH